MSTGTGNYGHFLFNGAIGGFLKRYRLALILLVESFLAFFSYTAAFYIRFDFDLPSEYLQIFNRGLPLLLISRIAAYSYHKIHAGSWRFAGIGDLIDILKAVLLGSVLFIMQVVFFYGLDNFPRSVFLMEGILNVVFMGGPRSVIRYYHEYRTRVNPKELRYVLIAGAGKAGARLLNEIQTNPRLGIRVLGFIDDDLYKKGINIRGVPVLGNTESIPDLAQRHSIDEVIVAIPSAGYKDIARIMKIAAGAQVKTRVLPGIGKLIREGSLTGQLGEESGLLGRKMVRFSRESDCMLMEKEIKGKSVLVTGAGGSIGSELSRQIARFRPGLLVLYERHENSLYDLELELGKEFPDQHFLPVIGDILDSGKIDCILRVNRVDLVYHAAAYKHVPMMEREPVEAVLNNVIGTMRIARAAMKNRVDKFVLVSTDKAVNPANIMGTTKRVAELIIQGLNGNGTVFVAVRFGNVIGSNGSVIPLFKKQMAAGGPLTVTHRDVSRYFMAIPEAVQLVMTAGAMGRGGEIFLLDMGEPIKVLDLATSLIRLSDLEPWKDIEIVFTGLRPGEKLHEELYWQGEGIIETENKKITMLVPGDNGSDDLFRNIELMEGYAANGDGENILRLLETIVPETRLDHGSRPEARPFGKGGIR